MSTGSGQKSKDTDLEVALRQALRGVGLHGYRLHHRIALPKFRGRPQHTTPDVVYLGHMVALYADGCYWHGCKTCDLQVRGANRQEWRKKAAVARARDERHSRYLVTIGWRVLRMWEHEDPKAFALAVKGVIDVDAPPGVYGLPHDYLAAGE